MSEDLSRVGIDEVTGESASSQSIQAVDGGAPADQVLADDETADPMDAVARHIDGEAGRVVEDLTGVGNIHTGGSREDTAANAARWDGPPALDVGLEIAHAQAEQAAATDQAAQPNAAAAAAAGRAERGAVEPPDATAPLEAGPMVEAAPAANRTAPAAAASPAPAFETPTAAPAGPAGGNGAPTTAGATPETPATPDAPVTTAPEVPTTPDTTTTTPTTPPVIETVVAAPVVATAPASGNEDTGIPLDVTAALGGDGSGVLSVTITGLPDGATLSAGTHNADGSWTLTADQLSGLVVYPPANSDADFSLSITATTVSNGQTVSTGASLAVTVNAVADAPTLTAAAVSGTEDQAVALNISSALVDRDGSESLTITISGVPDGASLSAGTHNADGSWTLTADQLSGLTLTPAANSDADFTLTVTATSTEAENGSRASTVVTVPVSINAVADVPSLSASSATGAEDKAIALDISSALADTDGSETLTVVLSGLPDGSKLSAGTHNGDGTWTLTADQLSGLTLTPPANYSGTISVTVTALATEAANGDTASTTSTISVTVTPVADAPSLTVANIVVDEASGHGAQAIPLNIAAALTDGDGSESFGTVTISGVPGDWTLSAGTNTGNGSWTLTQAQLSGLTISPPADYAVNSDGGTAPTLTVSVQSVENADHSQTATTLGSFTITVNPTADAPVAAATDVGGVEGTMVKLDLSAVQTDLHGPAETLSVSITGIPDGFELVKADGSAVGGATAGGWTLPADGLDNVFIRAEPGNTTAENTSGVIPLTLVVTSQDGSSVSAPVSVDFTVSYGGVADAPTLSVAAASGAEDSAIPLDIAAALVDLDGSETLSVTITGLPGGATLSAGTANADGSWTLSADQLSGLTVTPPANSDADFTLTVTATSTETLGGDSATTTLTLPVTVNAVADAPSLSATTATGTEDTAIPLDIAAALTDVDGSESLSITITGLPAGASLSAGTANADGSWTLSSDQLSGLTVTPPTNSGDDFTLTVTATSTEASNGDAASTTVTVPVIVNAVADQPTLSAAAASGNEDTAIALEISPALVDGDGSETLSITITGLPTGASLSAGTANADGSWTLSPGQLSGLTVTPPANSGDDFTLTVTALSAEGENGSTASRSVSLPVTVNAVADAPTLSASAASGSEDKPIALNIASALTDVDGSESLSITITGLPSGATLSAGTHNADGSYTLTSAQLSGLTVTPPANSDTDFTLTVTATSTEGENGSHASTTVTLPVTVAAVADTPTLTASAASGNEDKAIALNIASALTDTDGSESLVITITGVPAGATLSAGTVNADGSYTLTAGQLSGLTVTPAANSDGDFSLTVTATSTEAENGDQASRTVTVPVTVTAVADAPTLTAAAASGNEDTAIALNVASALTDLDGSESLSITISGLPSGATLSAGTHNADGSYTLTPAQLSGLTVTPGHDNATDFTLTVKATSTEAENGNQATTTVSLPVTVVAVADTPTLTASAASGNEDTAIPLSIASALSDVDGSESLSVKITGMPSGATLSAGTHNADGSWTLTGAQLSGLKLTPASNSDADFTLTVTATATESENGSKATQTVTVPVTVTAVADAPTLTATKATGNEDTAIALKISSALTDSDGSESLSITITGVPSDATLSAGTHNADGSWTLTQSQLTNLTVTPGRDNAGDFTLTVTATSTESSTGLSAVKTQTLPVTVTAVADAPTLTASADAGTEDQPVGLHIASALTDVDGSESLSITITGMPSGATLSAGTHNADGSWTLNSSQLSGLTLTPPANSDTDFTLTVTATSTEAENASKASTTVQVPITLAAVVDDPTLSVSNLVVSEQDGHGTQTFALTNLTAGLVDSDGSETLTVTVSGVPDGWSLTHGTHNADGSWTLSKADLTGLSITAPGDYSVLSESGGGLPTLTVTATTEEAGTPGVHGTATGSFTITVNPTADTAAVTAGVDTASGKGWEGTATKLDLSAVQTDTNGPAETLTLKLHIYDSPELLQLVDSDGHAVGTSDGSGTWTLTGVDLSNVYLAPIDGSKAAADLSGKIDLGFEVTSHDGASTATTTTPFTVDILGEADTPTLTLSSLGGTEDQFIRLNVGGGSTDVDGSETMSYSVDFGSGWAGKTLTFKIDGVQTNLTLDSEGKVSLAATQVDDLQVKAPGNWSGSETVQVTATATDYGGDTKSVTSSLTFDVAADADAATLKVNNATGSELETGSDPGIPLTVQVKLADTDGSETFQSIRISGVPDDWSLNKGTYVGGGTYTFTTADLDASGNISGLKATPPADYSDLDNGGKPITLTLSTTTVEASNGDTAAASKTFTVSVTPVSDTPDVAAKDVGGLEGAAVKLDLSAVQTDVYGGAEHLTVSIGGVGGSFELVDASGHAVGSRGGDGSWSVPSDSLNDVYIRPVAGTAAVDFGDGDLNLSVSVTSQDGTATPVTVTQDFTVHYEGVADTPTLAVKGATGSEDTAIALTITAAQTDADGSETISVRIDDIPSGAVLKVGGTEVFTASDGHGSVVLTEHQLSGLTITPPPDSNDDFTLKVTAISTEAGSGSTAEGATLELAVTVKGVADTPELVLPLASGTEDQSGGVPLNLNNVVVLGDNDSHNLTQSEVMSAVIKVPEGFTLSVGQVNADGSWSLTSEQLSQVHLIAPENYSGTVALEVKAIATERYEDGNTAGTGGVATNSFTLNVEVAPQVDATGNFQSAEGKEDTFIALKVDPAMPDSDGSETWSTVTIGDIPAGATLRYTDPTTSHTVEQTFAGGGSVILTQAQTAGLAIKPPADSNQDFSLSISMAVTDRATGADGRTMSDTKVIDGTLAVNVIGVADQPTLAAHDVSDTHRTVALDIAGSLSDTDGSEHAYYVISGVPEGVVLSNGYNNGDGSWTVTDVAGLTARLPSSMDSVTLDVQMVVQENDGDTNLDEAAVKDSFSITVSGGSGGGTGGGGSSGLGTVAGLEDQAAAVGTHLAGALGDATGTVTITGIPAGATVLGGSVAADGSVTVSADQLAGLTITPPANSGDDMTLQVSWTDGAADHSDQLTVAVTPMPDAPSVTVATGAAVEDQALRVTVDLAKVDADGSESVFLVVKGLPEGASLSGGIQLPDNSWTIPVERGDNTQTVALTVTPPQNYSGSLSFTVAGVSMEGETGEYAVTAVPVTVDVAARADAADISHTAAPVDEDHALALGLGVAVTDNSETVSQVLLTGLPDGFVLTDGTTTVTASGGAADVTGLDLASLSVVPPANYSGTISLSVAVTTQDGGDHQTNSSDLSLTFRPVTDEASVSVSNASGVEDHAVSLSLGAALVDTDGSEIMAVQISGLPEGGMLSAGTNNGDGSYTLTAAQLTGLTYLPPQDASGELTLTLTATTLERATGARAVVSQDFTVDLAPVADTPTLEVHTGTYATAEDIPVALSLSAAAADSSETVTVVFTGVPDHGSFNLGSAGATAGTWEITLGADVDLSTLTFTPPANADTGSGSYDMTVAVVSTETDGSSASVSDAVSITVSPVADAVTVGVHDVTVDEAAGHAPQVIDLAIAPQLIDSDGSETISTITITGVPEDWALNHGTQTGAGTWVLNASDLDGLSATVPADYAVNSDAGRAPTLTVSIDSYETANPGHVVTSTDSFAVTVTPTADVPVASATDATTAEGGAVQLDLTALQTDQHGPAESLTVSVGGLPAGFQLVDGDGNPYPVSGDGHWSLPADGLDNVYLQPDATDTDATNYSGSMALSLSVTAQDGSSVSAPVTAEFDVTFTPVADTPDLQVADATGSPGIEIPLDITAAATDSSETLSVMITVPDQGQLSAGTQTDGTNDWDVPPDHLPGLTLTLPDTTPVGDYSVTVTVTSTDGTDTAVASESLTVSVAEVEAAPVTAAAVGSDPAPVDPGTGGTEADAMLALDTAAQVAGSDAGTGDPVASDPGAPADGGGVGESYSPAAGPTAPAPEQHQEVSPVAA